MKAFKVLFAILIAALLSTYFLACMDAPTSTASGTVEEGREGRLPFDFAPEDTVKMLFPAGTVMNYVVSDYGAVTAIDGDTFLCVKVGAKTMLNDSTTKVTPNTDGAMSIVDGIKSLDAFDLYKLQPHQIPENDFLDWGGQAPTVQSYVMVDKDPAITIYGVTYFRIFYPQVRAYNIVGPGTSWNEQFTPSSDFENYQFETEENLQLWAYEQESHLDRTYRLMGLITRQTMSFTIGSGGSTNDDTEQPNLPWSTSHLGPTICSFNEYSWDNYFNEYTPDYVRTACLIGLEATLTNSEGTITVLDSLTAVSSFDRWERTTDYPWSETSTIYKVYATLLFSESNSPELVPEFSGPVKIGVTYFAQYDRRNSIEPPYVPEKWTYIPEDATGWDSQGLSSALRNQGWNWSSNSTPTYWGTTQSHDIDISGFHMRGDGTGFQSVNGIVTKIGDLDTCDGGDWKFNNNFTFRLTNSGDSQNSSVYDYNNVHGMQLYDILIISQVFHSGWGLPW